MNCTNCGIKLENDSNNETIYRKNDVIENAKKITELCNKLTCYEVKDFCNTKEFKKKDFPKNGVYVVFEEGETAFGQKRIVRVGTHKRNGRLIARLADHFRHNSLRSSVFRKLVSRALGTNDTKEVSDYMRNNMSFAVIPIDNKKDRLLVEEKIIATLSWWAFFNKDKAHSKDWIGKDLYDENNPKSTDQQISEFGLWLSDGLLKPPVTSDEDEIYKYLK